MHPLFFYSDPPLSALVFHRRSKISSKSCSFFCCSHWSLWFIFFIIWCFPLDPKGDARFRALITSRLTRASTSTPTIFLPLCLHPHPCPRPSVILWWSTLGRVNVLLASKDERKRRPCALSVRAFGRPRRQTTSSEIAQPVKEKKKDGKRDRLEERWWRKEEKGITNSMTTIEDYWDDCGEIISLTPFVLIELSMPSFSYQCGQDASTEFSLMPIRLPLDRCYMIDCRHHRRHRLIISIIVIIILSFTVDATSTSFRVVTFSIYIRQFREAHAFVFRMNSTCCCLCLFPLHSFQGFARNKVCAANSPVGRVEGNERDIESKCKLMIVKRE